MPYGKQAGGQGKVLRQMFHVLIGALLGKLCSLLPLVTWIEDYGNHVFLGKREIFS